MYKGISYETFRAVCEERGLLEHDDLWDKALTEADTCTVRDPPHPPGTTYVRQSPAAGKPQPGPPRMIKVVVARESAVRRDVEVLHFLKCFAPFCLVSLSLDFTL